MKKTLIIGASGQIGEKIGRLLSEDNLCVAAMVRNKNNASKLSIPGIDIVEADLEKDFSDAYTGCDRVVFSAGSGSETSADKTLLIDLWGACKAIDLAKQNNINHFVMISSRGADNPDNGPEAIKPYLIAKHFADNHLISSGLNYTILRPGRLIDEDGTGLVKTTRPINAGDQVISREDTALAAYYCLTSDITIGKIYELYKGQTPIETALLSNN